MAEALRRARTLYLATVALTLIFSVLYLYTDIALWTGRDFGLGIDSLQEITVASLTLHYTYHGTDILAMYTLLLLVAPLILLLLSIGEWYWVLIPSWLLWLAYQVYPEEASMPWYIRHGENFPAGRLAGAVRHRPRARLLPRGADRVAAALPPVAGGRWSRWAWPITLALISLAWGADKGVQFALLRHRPERARRVVLQGPAAARGDSSRSCRWRSSAYTAATYLWVPLRRVLGWLMLPLGQAALYSYIVHFFLILLVYNLTPLFATLPWEPSEDVFTPVLQIAVVLLLWVLVRKRVLFGIIPN